LICETNIFIIGKPTISSRLFLFPLIFIIGKPTMHI